MNKEHLGWSQVNRWGNVIYDEFVRPIERVVDFRTHISGIRPRDLRKGFLHLFMFRNLYMLGILYVVNE